MSTFYGIKNRLWLKKIENAHFFTTARGENRSRERKSKKEWKKCISDPNHTQKFLHEAEARIKDIEHFGRTSFAKPILSLWKQDAIRHVTSFPLIPNYSFLSGYPDFQQRHSVYSPYTKTNKSKLTFIEVELRDRNAWRQRPLSDIDSAMCEFRANLCFGIKRERKWKRYFVLSVWWYIS